MSSLLHDAYDPEHFRKQAHTLVDKLADYLDESLNDKNAEVFTSFDPDELFTRWQSHLNSPDEPDFFYWVDEVLKDSIHLHNPGYMGHQVSPVLPQAALVDFMGALLNNGMGVYEMGSPSVAMERVIIKHLAGQFGFDENTADGVLTSGGTLGNLTALLTMRQIQATGNVWSEGNNNRQLGVMVSEEAHYSISRAAKILGWGQKGIIKVSVDEQFKLDATKLGKKCQEASEQGIEILGVVGSACSTATGAFDPLNDIAEFCEKNNLWFHVDAAHGGAAIYSEKYNHLLTGIERADSVVMDFHKMLMCPALVTGVIFKNGDHSYQTFAQKAEYLWKQENKEWFNLGKRTFECTKNMMALKVYSILHSYGIDLFKENIERLFDLGIKLAELIDEHPHFELLTKPDCNIVCFRHCPPRQVDLNNHNEGLRKYIIKSGQHFIVQTNVKNDVYLRTALMNPFTTEAHLQKLLSRIDHQST